jgi:iron complex outermembrane recepter protein
MEKFRCTMLLGCAAVAAAYATPSRAQQAVAGEEQAAAPDVQLEEIVVTAQKRTESLQDTPISIAVLGGEALQERGIVNLTDFASGAVPSLRLVPFTGRSSAVTIGMRGIVPIDATQISRDPSVGVYVDGVYLGRVQGLGTEMFDVERIEVLRGPQGTLFGRNAVGGALSIVTRKPTGEFGFDLTAGLRNYSGFNLKGHLNLPEIAGISIKLDGVWSERDGWVDNRLAGQSDWYDYERRGMRVTALWQPIDDLDVQYSYDKSRDESVSGYAHIDRLLPGAPPLAPIFSLEPERVSRGRAGVPLEPSVGDVQGHSLHLTWDVADGLSFRSITAYRELEQSQFDNAAGSFLAFRPNGTFARYSLAGVEQDQFSQELQLVGSSERLDYVLGGFYFDEDASDFAHSPVTAQFNATGTGFVVLPAPAGGPFPDRASVAHAKSKALFAQATFTPPLLDDRLHLTGGLRWTHDEKDGRLTALRGAPTPLAFDFGSKRLDPAATVAFDWTDSINTYVRWGTAYRAGGANSRSSIFRPFEEEEVETWEVGLKADLLDRRARFNAAAYRTRFKNRQVDFPNPQNPSNTETVNTDDPATIKGVEIDVTLLPLPGLTLNAGYVYTDWKVPAEVSPFTGQTQRTVIAYTPDHAATGAVDYEFEPFSFGVVSAHLDANYSGSFFTLSASAPKTDPYLILNGRITLGEIRIGQTGSEIAVSLWGKNLTNEAWETVQFPLEGRGLINALTVHYNEPRTYGLEARLKF